MSTSIMKDGIMFRVSPKDAKVIQKSPDKGLNWTTVRSLSWEPQDLMVDGKDIIATTSNGKTYLSHDNGLNWLSR